MLREAARTRPQRPRFTQAPAGSGAALGVAWHQLHRALNATPALPRPTAVLAPPHLDPRLCKLQRRKQACWAAAHHHHALVPAAGPAAAAAAAARRGLRRLLRLLLLPLQLAGPLLQAAQACCCQGG